MKFGKREQIVILVVVGLVMIAGLHLTVFKSRATRYSTSVQRVQEMQSKANNLPTIREPRQLEELKKSTKTLNQEYADAVTSMSLSLPEVFLVPATAAEVNPADVKGATPPPANAASAVIQKFKQDNFEAVKKTKYEDQLTSVLQEIKTLQSFNKKTEGNRAKTTDMSFLGEGLEKSGWDLPVKLPDNIAGGRLEDLLREIDQTVGILRMIASSSPALQQEQRARYEAHLKELGISNDLYRDLGPASLSAKGEPVPLIHKLCHAALLEQAIGPGKKISDKTITRELLYDWLEIKLPYDRLEGLRVNDLYFVYEDLRFLNLLLALSVKREITQIFGVVLESPAYLREQADLTDPPDPIPPPKQPTPVASNPAVVSSSLSSGASGGPPTAVKVNPPGKEAVGLCLPIILQFRSNNLNAWNFIYDVLREIPLSELDQAEFHAASEAGDLFCQIRFLFVPHLFALDGGKAPGPPGPPKKK